MIIALILSLCGLSDAAIAQEYSLTDLGLAPRKEEIVQHLIQGEALFGDRVRAERMVGARSALSLFSFVLFHLFSFLFFFLSTALPLLFPLTPSSSRCPPLLLVSVVVCPPSSSLPLFLPPLPPPGFS